MNYLLEAPPKLEALPPASPEAIFEAIDHAKYKSIHPTAVDVLKKLKERPELVRSVLEYSKKPGKPDLH